ncbi:E3 ubiquitin- ligase RNF130-like [Olea europaea subsp. europaea]|uniref:E3 ubiquitin- ligase RNF130-like n=1 Tax=Olea europaea subsp. europaea TaxID=158383 RepID=A0A8S0PQV1_OLEEU|nr:E3 ubiquitin- ligase RNF130-like [Olea europaea subsp. europaea]
MDSCYWWASIRELNFPEPEVGNDTSSTTTIEVGFNFQIIKHLVNHQGNLYVEAQGLELLLIKTKLIHVDFAAADDELKQLLLSELAIYSIRNQNFKEQIVDELIYYARTRDTTVREMILELHLKKLYCNDGDGSSLQLMEFDPVSMDTILWPSEKIVPYKNDNDEFETCTVCLEEISAGSLVSTLTCSHVFHSSCIFEWLNRSENCPICRFELIVHPVRLSVLGLVNNV